MDENELRDAIFTDALGDARGVDVDLDLDQRAVAALIAIANRLDKQCELTEQSIELMRQATEQQKAAFDKLGD